MPDGRAHEANIVEFLRRIEPTARALYLVGDVLDYWFEYRTVVPRGHIRFFGQLARMADAGVEITWLTGNHDIWLFDYLRDEIGVRIVDGNLTEQIDGRRFFISHGDGLGRVPTGFRIIRSIFRNKLAQKLYSAIHPRWTIPFAHAWSSGSRGYDNQSELPSWHGTIQTNVTSWAENYAHAHPDTDFIVLGHHHVMVNEALKTGCRLVILGDWIRHDSYAVVRNGQLQLLRYAPNS